MPIIWVASPFPALLVNSTQTSRPNTTSSRKPPLIAPCNKLYLHSTLIIWTKSLGIVSYIFFKWILGGMDCPLQSFSCGDVWESTIACRKAIDKNNTQFFPFTNLLSTVKFPSSLLVCLPGAVSILLCLFAVLNWTLWQEQWHHCLSFHHTSQLSQPKTTNWF